MEESRHGGPREGAGRPHEHEAYVLVEVVDFHGDKDTLVVGLYLNRDGVTPNKATERRAEEIAAHHVGEQARSVRILKRLCCSIGDSVELKVVKAMAETIDLASLPADVQEEIDRYPEDVDLIFYVHETTNEVRSIQSGQQELLNAQGGMGSDWRQVTL